MKRTLVISALLMFSLLRWTQAQAQKSAPIRANGGPARLTVSADGDLESVLLQMDQSAATFKSAQADFEWDQYQKAVEEHFVQKGQIYFRRSSGGVDAALNVTSPAAKQIVFKDGKLRIYEKKIDQVTEHDAGQNRSDVEDIVRLGFGARGHDLLKSYEVKLNGWEDIDGARTAKLELVPLKSKFRAMFSRVLLWIDPKQDVSIRQQLFEPSGDYRLAHYTGIKLNSKVPSEVFEIKTTSHTKKIKPD